MSTAYAINSTDVTTYWLCLVASTGVPDTTGIAYNATGLTLQYNRVRAAAVSAVTGGGTAPVTLAAANTAHTDWGFLHIGGGVHRADFPDAAFATGVDGVILAVFGVSDRTFVMLPMVDLVGSDPRAAAASDASIAAATADATRDDFILFLQEGVNLPGTTGTATMLNSAGVSQNVSITTSGTAERITATT